IIGHLLSLRPRVLVPESPPRIRDMVAEAMPTPPCLVRIRWNTVKIARVFLNHLLICSFSLLRMNHLRPTKPLPMGFRTKTILLEGESLCPDQYRFSATYASRQ